MRACGKLRIDTGCDCGLPKLDKKLKGAGHRNKLPNGIYNALLDEVEAMQIGDVLRWDLAKEKFESACTRISSDVNTKTWRQWYNGQIWIVRYA